MGYYEDLHNLRSGKTVPIVGPIEDYEEDECDNEPETVYSQPKPVDKEIDPDYLAHLEKQHSEKQLKKLVNDVSIVAGAVLVWNVLNEKS